MTVAVSVSFQWESKLSVFELGHNWVAYNFKLKQGLAEGDFAQSKLGNKGVVNIW